MVYFTVGWPRLHQVEGCLEGESIVCLKVAADGRYIAVLTQHQIFIFSGNRSRSLLGVHSFDTDQSSYLDLVWNQEEEGTSNSIAVLTSSGAVVFYGIKEQGVQYTYKKGSRSMPASPLLSQNNALGIPFVHFTTEYQLKVHATALTTCHSVILATSEDFLLHILSWDGYSVLTIPLSALLESSEVPLTRVTSMCGAVDCIGFVLQDGRAAIVRLNIPGSHSKDSSYLVEYLEESSDTTEESKAEKAEWLVQAGARLMSYSVKHRLMAIGHRSGEVSLFQAVSYDIDSSSWEADLGHVSESHHRRDSYDILRVFSLAHWGISPEDIGPVSALQWSPDGSVLAVGWKERGLSVWSAYGCRLMCTIPQLEGCREIGSDDLDPLNTKWDEPVLQGSQSVAWGEGGFSLLVAERREENKEQKLVIMEFNTVKNALTQNPNLNYAHKLILIGDDRLYLLEKQKVDLKTLRWSQLTVPSVYLEENWPIQNVAVNRQGNDLAIAGKKGFVLYNCRTRKWKMFSDQKHERSILCSGLCWYKTTVIVCNRVTAHNNLFRSTSAHDSYTLLGFSNSHLSLHETVLKMEIPQSRTPVAMDCNDRHLVYFTKDGFFFHYLVVENPQYHSITLRLLHQISSTNNTAILNFLLLPSNIGTSADRENRTNCLVLNDIGRLSIMAGETGKETVLFQNTEQFWYGGNTTTQTIGRRETPLFHEQELGNSLWAYGEGGLQIWFPLIANVEEKGKAELLMSTRLLSRDKSLEFDMEVYPVGFLPDLGIVVGLSQGLSACPMSNLCTFPRFDMKTKTHPFLHTVLRHILLVQQKMDEALSVANKFSFIPHFEHSLELLLHEVLESSESTSSLSTSSSSAPDPNFNGRPQETLSTGRTTITASSSSRSHRRVPSAQYTRRLSLVLDFLKTFHAYPEVVVRCARKTDVTFWDALFEHAGSPVHLFTQCVQRQFLLSAASYLRVVHLLEGTIQARKCAYLLLEKILSLNCLEFLPDLMRFLDPARLELDRELDERENSQRSHRRTSSAAAVNTDEEYYLQEMILERHARTLLLQMRLKDFLTLGRALGRELREWLLRERDRAAVLDQRFEVAIRAIHSSFKLPYSISMHRTNAKPLVSVSSEAPPHHSPRQGAGDEELETNFYYPQRSSSIPSEEEARTALWSHPTLPPSPARIPSLKPQKGGRKASGTMQAAGNSPSHRINSTGITFSQNNIIGETYWYEEVQQQLSSLLFETYNAQCFDWALCLACVLGNEDVALAILRTSQENWPPLEEALTSLGTAAYITFRDRLRAGLVASI